MSQLIKLQYAEFQIISQITEKTGLYKRGQEQWICKQIVLDKKKTQKELIDEIDQMKIRLQKAGIYIPEGYMEDKQGISLVYKRFKNSMGDLIRVHRRQGKFITMNLMQKYVDEYTNWLDKIHKSKKTEAQRFCHCRIKPQNLFEDEDGNCVITDFQQFSNENNEYYLPPESIAIIKKNQSYTYAQSGQGDQFGIDPQKIDVWQLGIVFLQMASLREIEELIVFRDLQAHESQKAIEIREIVRKTYGNHLINLIEKMLEKNPNNRPLLSDLEDLVQDFFSQNAIIADEKLMATINKQQLSIFDDVMKFVKESQTLLLGEFEIREQNYRNQLDLEVFIMVLKKFNGPNIQLLEMKTLADQLGVLQDNNINYKIFCLKAKQYQVGSPSTKIEAILTNLKVQLKNKNTNTIEISQEYDINQKGKVKVKALKMGLFDKQISINDDELELLYTIIEKDAQDQIDYYAFNDLINQGLAKYKESRESSIVNSDDLESKLQNEFLQFIIKQLQDRDETANSYYKCNQEIDKIVFSFSQYMEKETCTLLDLYRQTDKDRDYYISNEEFTDLLQSTIGYTSSQNVQKQLFEIFDMDSDGKINFMEFEYQVYKRNEITVNQIEEMKNVMLNGRNPQIEQQISTLFYIISKGSVYIDFRQFLMHINQYKKYRILELDQFFRYFDKKYTEKVDQFRFILYFQQQQTKGLEHINNPSKIKKFDLSFYKQELQKKCIQKNIDLFDLLCYYGETDLTISKPMQLQQAFLFLEIMAPISDIEQFYYTYMEGENGYMSITQLYLQMNNPGKLLAKALNFLMVKQKQWTRQKIWNIIGESTWGISQFQTINQELYLGLKNHELGKAFQYWDAQNLGKITYTMYEEILNLNQIVVPTKNNNIIKKKQSQ
ncbi:unnamed protein product [Paramecium sonneborni]|uniref:non-specific serine/threonine protein kinase n=1 Tax=Paramecium sonneborni TaxID=65129 RepID=A0A8S1R6J6_9CILI|nr:unnamed protein product [Paramecium sonneborni]